MSYLPLIPIVLFAAVSFGLQRVAKSGALLALSAGALALFFITFGIIDKRPQTWFFAFLAVVVAIRHFQAHRAT